MQYSQFVYRRKVRSKMSTYFIFCLVLSFFVRTEGCRLCPDGIRKFACFVNPCRQISCDGATCRPNYCGGCNRLWYQNGMDVTKLCEFQCPSVANCLPGVEVVTCFVDPCKPLGIPITCPGFPSAQCCASYCGGCHAVWYLSGVQVMCQEGK